MLSQSNVTASGRILVAEDDDLTRELLVKVLRREGYSIVEAGDGGEALQLLGREAFDLVLSDIQMARASGMELLREVRARMPETPVVLITAFVEPGAAMDAIAQGATDYLAKPVDVMALRGAVAGALERRRLTRENRQLRDEVAQKKTLVGTSPVMIELYKQIAQIATTDATVLLTGESGSGKELVARTLHERSRRARGPYLAVNCAAVAETLLESELFGHERGAFTGAHTMRRGFFEEASGGTLLLDEVGDVPLKMQAQLLRVLQEGEVRRVGGSTPTPVDVRVIAATNRDLTEDVEQGRIRRDLFYRINVVHIRVPPLRERGDDVVLLARHLLARHAFALGRPVPEISDAVLARIRSHPWPGNVRELDNALARALAMSRNNVLLPGDLPPALADESDVARSSIDHDWPRLDELQRRYIDRVLARTGGNKTAAANILGVDRRTLQRLDDKSSDDSE